ncbi:hypothetical protein E2C01_020906 [Portunus trituberculatus]|uniref:Uncharacterized protein n=1 Tax=Portunus trituberculatus TaxID=210409 RepID=A0A5B7E314_PORTR|nr:hypothetical protein [Portunus trituberculatus]
MRPSESELHSTQQSPFHVVSEVELLCDAQLHKLGHQSPCATYSLMLYQYPGQSQVTDYLNPDRLMQYFGFRRSRSEAQHLFLNSCRRGDKMWCSFRRLDSYSAITASIIMILLTTDRSEMRQQFEGMRDSLLLFVYSRDTDLPIQAVGEVQEVDSQDTVLCSLMTSTPSAAVLRGGVLS